MKDANPEPNLLTVARPELYIIRRKGTAGVTRALRRAAPYKNKVLQCL